MLQFHTYTCLESLLCPVKLLYHCLERFGCGFLQVANKDLKILACNHDSTNHSLSFILFMNYKDLLYILHVLVESVIHQHCLLIRFLWAWFVVGQKLVSSCIGSCLGISMSILLGSASSSTLGIPMNIILLDVLAIGLKLDVSSKLRKMQILVQGQPGSN